MAVLGADCPLAVIAEKQPGRTPTYFLRLEGFVEKSAVQVNMRDVKNQLISIGTFQVGKEGRLHDFDGDIADFVLEGRPSAESVTFIVADAKGRAAQTLAFPNPIRVVKGRYLLTVVEIGPYAVLWAARGEGFDPGECVTVRIVFDNASNLTEVIADQEGVVKIPMEPAVSDLLGGQATIQINGRYGPISASYKWGFMFLNPHSQDLKAVQGN